MTTVGRSANVKARGTAEPGTIVGSAVTTGRSETIRASGTGFPGTQVGSSATVGRSQVVRIPGGGIGLGFDRTVWGGPEIVDFWPAKLPDYAPFALGPVLWDQAYTDWGDSSWDASATFAPLAIAEDPLEWTDGYGLPPAPWINYPFTLTLLYDDDNALPIEQVEVTAADWPYSTISRGIGGKPAGAFPDGGTAQAFRHYGSGSIVDDGIAFTMPDPGDPDGVRWTGEDTYAASVVPTITGECLVVWRFDIERAGSG